MNISQPDCTEEISIARTWSGCTASDNIKTHFGRICSLQLYLNAIQFPLESILRTCIKHLTPHPRCVRRPWQTKGKQKWGSRSQHTIKTLQREKPLPSNEENFALLAIFLSYKVEVIDRISTLICWQTCREIIVALGGLPKFLDNHLLKCLVYLINDETISSLRLQLQKFQLTVIVHSHSRRCICLDINPMTSTGMHKVWSMQSQKIAELRRNWIVSWLNRI